MLLVQITGMTLTELPTLLQKNTIGRSVKKEEQNHVVWKQDYAFGQWCWNSRGEAQRQQMLPFAPFLLPWQSEKGGIQTRSGRSSQDA